MPRQGKNIYLRKDGRWEGRYSKGKINGKTRYGYVFGKTYEEVEQKLYAASTVHSEIAMKTGISFEDISFEWLCSLRPELKASSYAKYLNLLNSYLNPSFGILPIQSISRNEVLKFSRDMLVNGGIKKRGLSPKTVNRVISVMKNILD